MANEVTLNDLVKSTESKDNNTVDKNSFNNVKRSTNIKNATKASINDLGKDLSKNNKDINKDKEPPKAETPPLVKDAFQSMRDTLDKKKKFYEEEVFPVIMDNAREIAMERQFGYKEEEDDNTPKNSNEQDPENDFAILDEDDEPKKADAGSVNVAPSIDKENINVAKEEPKKKPVDNKKKSNDDEEDDDSILDSMMKDLDLEDDNSLLADDEEEETTEEIRERFKESLSGISVTKDPLDLTTFKISTTPITSSMALNNVTNANIRRRADHPLMYTGRNMTFEECSGPELDALRKTINSSNNINGVIASLRFVYNHVVDANKPVFETWCKSIRTEDAESLYFGIYKACYSSTNLVARMDTKEDNRNNTGCGKTSLINTSIDDMIKFNDDEAKELYNRLMGMDSTTPGNKIKSNLMPISDDFAITYSDPTLYSTFIQYSTLKQDIVDKYSDQLNTLAYITGFYKIDKANQNLIPIAIKEYPKNINKTIMSKLKTYLDILKTLTNDQYNIMTSKLDNVIGDPKITYIHPEVVCPECGHTIPEEEVDSMINLLFLRAQLVQVKSL